MDTGLPLAAWRRAPERRQVRLGLLHHSERGVQYARRRYQDLLRRHGLRISMSRKGNGWDNSVVESFFSTLKTELHPTTGATRAEAHRALAEYIDGFYNARRLHSTLGYRSTADFEAEFKVAI